MKLKSLGWTSAILTLIGAVNWGLVGMFRYDLVTKLLGTMTMASRVVYSLIGISAVYFAYLLFKK